MENSSRADSVPVIGEPTKLPQLKMRRASLADLPPVELPEGYELRTYQPGDEAAWADIMNTGIGSGWTEERCRERLTGLPQFDPAGLYFATFAGEPVGSACAWRATPDETREGQVHMVCVRPENRGRRLGYWLTLSTLHYFAEHGFESAWLGTDDFRLGAIRIYLDLGFRPEQTHPADPERWRPILTRLRERLPDWIGQPSQAHRR